MLVAVVVALIIGLGVGLTAGLRKKDAESFPTFDVNITQISTESFEPYGSCDELRLDLIEATKYLANSRIDSNARAYYHQDYRSRGCESCAFGQPQPLASQDVAESAGTTSNTNSQPRAEPLPDVSGEDSFQTNNQVEGVDEADVVKSDGTHVFAVYGREVVTLDADNVTVLSRTVVPVLKVNNGTISFDTTASDANEGFYTSSPEHYCDSSIVSLLLHQDRLTVITTGWCDFYDSNGIYIGRTLSNRASTNIFVYDVSTIPTDGVSPLSLLNSAYVQGYYSTARSIQESVHIVTTSYVNSYLPFTSAMDIYGSGVYDGLLENQYRTKAHEIAKGKVEAFADELLADIKAARNDDTCAGFVRLSSLQSSQKTTAGSDTTTSAQLDFTGNGVMSSMGLITSFNMTADLVTDGIQLSSSAMMLPTSSWTVYASQEKLILAGQGWQEDTEGRWGEETYLIGYTLDGASSRAQSIGRVPGYVLNQFSLDHQEKNGIDYLRVATTNSATWGFVGNNPRVWGQVVESSSQVTVLEIPKDASPNRTMEVVGSVSGIGRTERIYSVRFLGDRAFVVTFRQVDPFYTLNMTDPSNPVVVGELKIPGFSNYLHQVGPDLILGVGQDADEATGRTNGLQISLFNVSNFSFPERIHNFVADNSDSSSSSSAAQYDHRAFRYLDQSQVLILPVRIDAWTTNVDSFDGFYVYSVDPDQGISLKFPIVHADYAQIRYGCWSYRSFLTPRSLVFAGNVMTLKAHTVRSHNLQTSLSLVPPVNLDASLPSSKCSTRYYVD